MKELVFSRYLIPVVERYADKVGFREAGYDATFAQHTDRILRLADAMHTQFGLEAKDRFAILAANSHRFLELYHAGFLGAGIVNPLNLRLSPKELAFILNDSGTKLIFTDPMFATLVDQVREEAGIEKVVLMGDADVPHDVGFEDLLGAGEPRFPPEPEEDDPSVLMYTGGTTGLPKGVVLDQRAELLNLYHVGIAIGFDDNRVYLHQTPMFHAAAMAAIIGIPGTGGTSVFIPFFQPEAVLDACERYQVNQTVMVPTMLAMLLNHPEFRPERLASLRQLTYGAAPMPPSLLDRVREQLPDLELTQGYGMTESSSVLTFLTAEDHAIGGERLRSVGRPLIGVRISVRDPQGEVCAVGQPGEVWAQSGNLLREYWQRPHETEEALRDGWYHTGDMGYLDADGYLYLVDRVKDMIVTGGENVYSIEVENAIASHPAVAQVAVIGIPHDVWGEAVHAIVVPVPQSTVTEDELIAHARQTLGGYKVPKSVEFRKEPIPLSGALKPLKRELRLPYWTKAGEHADT